MSTFSEEIPRGYDLRSVQFGMLVARSLMREKPDEVEAIMSAWLADVAAAIRYRKSIASARET